MPHASCVALGKLPHLSVPPGSCKIRMLHDRLLDEELTYIKGLEQQRWARAWCSIMFAMVRIPVSQMAKLRLRDNDELSQSTPRSGPGLCHSRINDPFYCYLSGILLPSAHHLNGFLQLGPARALAFNPRQTPRDPSLASNPVTVL